MKFLGPIPRIFSFLGKMLSSSKKQKDDTIDLHSRYSIHISAQRYVNRDRQHRK